MRIAHYPPNRVEVMSYFFVTTLQVFFCITLLSSVLWGRGEPPSLRPLTWTLLTALAVGGNYFSTVLTINVTDPVDGTVLTNTTAEYKYSYAGRTWFFASEANYNRFRNAPEAFVPGTVQEE